MSAACALLIRLISLLHKTTPQCSGCGKIASHCDCCQSYTQAQLAGPAGRAAQLHECSMHQHKCPATIMRGGQHARGSARLNNWSIQAMSSVTCPTKQVRSRCGWAYIGMQHQAHNRAGVPGPCAVELRGAISYCIYCNKRAYRALVNMQETALSSTNEHP